MDVSKLAEALGMPKDSPAEKVFASAATSVLESKKSQEELSQLVEQLTPLGLAVKDGQVVKTGKAGDGLDTKIKDGDSAEVVELKKRIAAQEVETTKTKLSQAKAEVEKYIKDGKVPPAMKDELSKLMSITDKAESLALSAKGDEVVKVTFDALASLKKILDAVPSISELRLSQLSPSAEDKKESEALAAKAKEVAARVQGKKQTQGAGK